MVWSPYLNLFQARLAATRYPVIMQDPAQLSGLERSGSGITSSFFFLGICVTYQPIMFASYLWKNNRRKYLCQDSSTGWNYSPNMGVMRCTKDYFCSREFCIMEYATCGYQHATSANIFTSPLHTRNLSPNHVSFPPTSSMYHPR